jgi:diamine N-acetyltransferase
MTNNLQYRQATQDDLDVLYKISIETFTTAFAHLNNADDFEDYITKHKSKDALSNELNVEGSKFFLVFLDGDRLCGYLKVNLAKAQSDVHDINSLEIERIYLLSNYQNKGIGEAMILFCERYAKEEGLKYIWLGVWEKNTRAIAFYQLK